MVGGWVFFEGLWLATIGWRKGEDDEKKGEGKVD